VALYVENGLKGSRLLSPTAQITDITHEAITIQTSVLPIPLNYIIPFTLTHTLPLEPPLTSLSEARTRLIEIDQESRAALGRSTLTIDTYAPPATPFHIFVFALCLSTFIMLSRDAFVSPGGWAYEAFLKRISGLAEFTQWARVTILGLMVVIHSTEAYFMAGRCKKYGVGIGTGAWWLWEISTFIEGFGAFQRYEPLYFFALLSFSDLPAWWNRKRRQCRNANTERIDTPYRRWIKNYSLLISNTVAM
jgi:hypothetical protein